LWENAAAPLFNGILMGKTRKPPGKITGASNPKVKNQKSKRGGEMAPPPGDLEVHHKQKE